MRGAEELVIMGFSVILPGLIRQATWKLKARWTFTNELITKGLPVLSGWRRVTPLEFNVKWIK